ncbi:MAG: hypothetical protein GQ574_14475 [Crocinitomix sp.]|nr:hypothetical protein [Crocinitomix sp.]
MFTTTLFRNLSPFLFTLLLVLSSCGGKKEKKDWIEDLGNSQNNSVPTAATSVPNLVGDWIQVKMEFSSPFNGTEVANVDFENQVIWSFSKDSIQIFEYPQFETAHGPYSCKDNTVSFKQTNDAPVEVVNVFEQFGDTIKFTNTQGPITNYIYFVPFQAGDELNILKQSHVNWSIVFQEDWEFFNVRQLPGFEAVEFDEFTPPSKFTSATLSAKKFDNHGAVINYQAPEGDYDLKFIEFHEWLDTFYFSLEVIHENESVNKALQYYRLGDIPKPFNSY